MSIKNEEKVMKEKCLCEDCDSKKILKHFEECKACGSKSYHSTPSKLNIEKKKAKPEKPGNKIIRRRW